MPDVREIPAASLEMTRGDGDSDVPATHPGALSAWIAHISGIPLLSHEEEVALARRIREGDRKAFVRLVESNLRLVVRVATRYSHPNIPLLDLIQEGNLGLIKAAERFDAEKGYRFSTYAVWWIRRAILRALCYNARLVRLPEHILALSSRLERASVQLRQTFGREPSEEELANLLRTSEEQVEWLSTIGHDHVSLDAESPFADSLPYRDVVEDANQSPAKWWERLTRAEEVNQMLQVLPPREQAVLRARFGLDTGRPLTLKETGAEFHLTRERIRQIEKRALSTLRAAWEMPPVAERTFAASPMAS